MKEGSSGTMGAQKRELIPLTREDKDGLYIGHATKAGPEE